MFFGNPGFGILRIAGGTPLMQASLYIVPPIPIPYLSEGKGAGRGSGGPLPPCAQTLHPTASLERTEHHTELKLCMVLEKQTKEGSEGSFLRKSLCFEAPRVRQSLGCCSQTMIDEKITPESRFSTLIRTSALSQHTAT